MEWHELPEDARSTIIAAAKSGIRTVGGLFQRCPDLPDFVLDVYEGFHLCDRNPMSGSLTFEGMLLVLNWMGVKERRDQASIMNVWRAMQSGARDKSDELRKLKEDEEKNRGNSSSRVPR